MKLIATSAKHATKYTIRAKVDDRGYAILNARQVERMTALICGMTGCKDPHYIDSDVTIDRDGERWITQKAYPSGAVTLMPQKEAVR